MCETPHINQYFFPFQVLEKNLSTQCAGSSSKIHKCASLTTGVTTQTCDLSLPSTTNTTLRTLMTLYSLI